MDNSRKKQIIIVAICLIGVFVIAAIFHNPSGRSGSYVRFPIQMLCVNCGAEFEISNDTYRKQMEEKGAIDPMGPTGPPPGLVCPKCGQESAYVAVKCIKCGSVFIPNKAVSNDYQDRCPECGYSATEEKSLSYRNKK